MGWLAKESFVGGDGPEEPTVKKILIIAVILLFATGALGYWKFHKTATPASDVPTAANSSIEKVGYGNVVLSIATTGKVVSNLDVEIKCRASGEIIGLPLDVSDVVHKGALLVELDPTDAKRDIRRAEATVAQAQAQVAQAEANLHMAEQDVITTRMKANANLASAQVQQRIAAAKNERRKQLVAENLGAAEDLETTEAEAAVADAQLRSAEAQVEEVKDKEVGVEVQRQQVAQAQAALSADQIALADAQQQLVYTKVMSPMEGVVSARAVQLGTIIASGITNVSGGTTVMTLSDLSHIFVLASVDEADIGGIAMGQRVIVTADAWPNETFEGKVVQLPVQGTTISSVVTFEVRIEITSDNKKLLKPEMTANAQVISQDQEHVLTVPAQAISREADGSQVVRVVSSGTLAAGNLVTEARKVTIGLTDGEHTEIIDGLSEGDHILVRKETISKWSQAGQAAANAPATSGAQAQSKSSPPPPPGGM